MQCDSDCSGCGSWCFTPFGDSEYNLCPLCKEKGKNVKNKTVSSSVINTMKNLVGEDDYVLCMNPSCTMGYFNKDTGQMFLTDHLTLSIDKLIKNDE